MKKNMTLSQQLTNALKKAQKIDWWGTDSRLYTFGFASKWPAYIDWRMIDSEERALYDEIKDLTYQITYVNNGKLTDYQYNVLNS